MKIYHAGPLFTKAQRAWMRKVQKAIEELAESKGKRVKKIWPYEFVTQSEIYYLGEKAKFEIFSRCKS